MENFAPAINNDSNVAEGHIKKTKLGVGFTYVRVPQIKKICFCLRIVRAVFNCKF